MTALSFTISQSLLKLMSIDSVMLSNRLILDPDAGKDWRQKKSLAEDEMLVICKELNRILLRVRKQVKKAFISGTSAFIFYFQKFFCLFSDF